jgi:hypothetical protein
MNGLLAQLIVQGGTVAAPLSRHAAGDGVGAGGGGVTGVGPFEGCVGTWITGVGGVLLAAG